jgi:hypothetical protein
MISHSSFTDEVLARVKERSNRHVLLVSGAEIENLVRRSSSLVGLLRRKRDHLLVDPQVALDDRTQQPVRKRTRIGDLSAPGAEFVSPDGERMNYFTSAGSFGEFTFAHEMQSKANHDFREQELELKTNTELTRETRRLTTELYSQVIGDDPGKQPS